MLRFGDPVVERAWRDHRDDEARGPVRLGLVLFGALIMLAALGDEWQGYEGWRTVIVLRFAVWGPLALGGAGLVSLPRLRGRVLDITFGVTVLLTLSLIATMWFAMPRSAAIDYPMYWTVLLVLVHVVAPLDMVRACLAGAVAVGGYLGTMFRFDAAPPHFAAHTVFVLFAWTLLIAASWLLERRARATFWAERQLRARTGELDALTRLQASVLDTLAEGVCGVDAEGAVTFANPAAALLLGRPASSIVGVRFHDVFHDAEPGACALCASPSPVQDVPARLRLPDGGVRWVEGSARPSEGAGQRVISFRDVGHRRALEDSVRQSQKMDAIGLFVGGVAHEFNNLLTPMLGGIELAGKRLGPDHPLHASLDAVARAGERTAALVRQLLVLGRRTELAPRALDVSATVTQVIAVLRPMVDRRIEIAFAPTPGAWALADPGQVHQVLLVLCLNARDALLSEPRRDGPGRIDIAVRRVELDDEAALVDPSARPGTWIELAVADDGPGIPADVLPRVFEPFFTTRRHGEGAGLGLAVLHGIVHQHGGWVSVDTAPGAGTRFRCTFPATTAPSVEEDVAASAHRVTTEPARSVLLVDDEQMVRDVTRAALEHFDYAVEEADSGTAALDRLQAGYRPDVVVLDILMPGLDGWGTLARIRALDATIPVVMLSGYDGNASEARPHAPDAHVQKPYRLREFVAVLDEAIARRRAAAAPPAPG